MRRRSMQVGRRSGRPTVPAPGRVSRWASARGARLGLERHDGYWRWVGGPVPRGAAAITIGSVISMRRRAADDALLLRHELVHVRQWRELGGVRFVVRYLGAYAGWRLRGFPHAAAYRRIPLEVEADWDSRGSAPI